MLFVETPSDVSTFFGKGRMKLYSDLWLPAEIELSIRVLCHQVWLKHRDLKRLLTWGHSTKCDVEISRC